ncbi:hypothetical protein ILYODFUR_023833 [Ilyodon furcidens]|uniref:TTC3/DZIP3-like helical domain-containing protein n=1 Tax=Ilyodon furcidens TaxID=33524 RepID=A0ABV0TEG5_9TELE
MSLEDEINRFKALLASAARRSHTAQLSVAESSRDQGLYGLYGELADAKALLSKLDEAAHRTPSQELETTRSGCKAKVEEVEKSISTVERRFQEQQDQVKKGRRVCDLPLADDSRPPEPAAAPVRPVQHVAFIRLSSHQNSAEGFQGFSCFLVKVSSSLVSFPLCNRDDCRSSAFMSLIRQAANVLHLRYVFCQLLVVRSVLQICGDAAFNLEIWFGQIFLGSSL